MNHKDVANAGSALGEAIGVAMGKSLEQKLIEIADSHGCHYLTSGLRKTKGGTVVKKLLMSDNYGNEYDIDGVIANESMQPLIIFESKYIRYKKHNRDKGSWICTAHSAVRRRYHSIRSSIAVLAGSWSKSSIAMMHSHDINFFLIPFDYICQLLAEVGIDFNWGEKEKEKSFVAWNKYNLLSEEQKNHIGNKMVEVIQSNLVTIIQKILDDTVPREIAKVVIELRSNLGEVKVFEFDSLEKAMIFLDREDLDSVFITGDSATLFDPPPKFDEDE